VRLGAGAEFLYRSGTATASLKFRALNALFWGDNGGLGLTADFGHRVGWNGGFGGLLAAHTEEALGTPLNFLLRGSYCGRQLCLSLVHLSHGALFGIARDKSNQGLNFLLLEYRR